MEDLQFCQSSCLNSLMYKYNQIMYIEHESSKEIKSKNDFIILVFFSMIPFNFEKCEWFSHELVIKSNQMTSEYKWMQPDAASCAI